MDRNRKIDVMGIVNITDNSYFAESRCLGGDGDPDMERILPRARKMVEEGASILDVGACSTRPGSDPVGEEEEWRRLRPVLSELRREFPEVTISVDTYWAGVVSRVFDIIGPFIVNDISAGEDDPSMLSTVARLGLPYIAMHKRGSPKTMQSLTDYPEGVVAEVSRYFREFARKAADAGIKEWILDPGYGFAKTIDQNYELLAGLPEVIMPGCRTLVGVSRKSMIYRLFNTSPEVSLPETQVLHLAALQNGADILRVHDVLPAVHTVELYRKLA